MQFLAFPRERELDFTLRKMDKCSEIEAWSAEMVARGESI
jgi:hypothetical protein